MLKYVDAKVVFAEVPDEITLAINISNCPCQCKGCHSSYLAQDIGTELTFNEVRKLIKKNSGISCIAIMGGDAEPDKINTLASFIINHYNSIKVAWYSGRQELSKEIDLQNFDAIKLGGYNESLGPLNCPTTNQRFYKIIEGKMYDYTYLFWKDSEVEIWRDIDGFDGYQVSNLGNVRSLNYNGTGNVQLLKPSLSGPNRGYKSISMQVADKVIRRNVHRLVAQYINGPLQGISPFDFTDLKVEVHHSESKRHNECYNLIVCLDKKVHAQFDAAKRAREKAKMEQKEYLIAA